MSEKGHPEHIRSLASIPPRYTVDVHGCTNALKDRMSEKEHPEHRHSFTSM